MYSPILVNAIVDDGRLKFELRVKSRSAEINVDPTLTSSSPPSTTSHPSPQSPPSLTHPLHPTPPHPSQSAPLPSIEGCGRLDHTRNDAIPKPLRPGAANGKTGQRNGGWWRMTEGRAEHGCGSTKLIRGSGSPVITDPRGSGYGFRRREGYLRVPPTRSDPVPIFKLRFNELQQTLTRTAHADSPRQRHRAAHTDSRYQDSRFQTTRRRRAGSARPRTDDTTRCGNDTGGRIIATSFSGLTPAHQRRRKGRRDQGETRERETHKPPCMPRTWSTGVPHHPPATSCRGPAPPAMSSRGARHRDDGPAPPRRCATAPAHGEHGPALPPTSSRGARRRDDGPAPPRCPARSTPSGSIPRSAPLPAPSPGPSFPSQSTIDTASLTEGCRLRGARRRRGREFPDTDPMGNYARRSSILQPSRLGSTYNSPLPGSYIPVFIESSSTAGAGGGYKLGNGQTASNMVPFPTQGYVVPARSRTGSTTRGEMIAVDDVDPRALGGARRRAGDGRARACSLLGYSRAPRRHLVYTLL
ncbi:hypothetical protein BJ912DRAFT_1056496 [Pholiota molesta]|nr:hypothetical protein BJ912DRAFT_1056496 [Pholiota molesta]